MPEEEGRKRRKKKGRKEGSKQRRDGEGGQKSPLVINDHNSICVKFERLILEENQVVSGDESCLVLCF